MREFDTKKGERAQRDFCELNNLPCLVPPRGICAKCGNSAYALSFGIDGSERGYSVRLAGSMYISVCPHCGKCFYD